MGDTGVIEDTLLSKNSQSSWGHKTNRRETITEQWSLKKYAEATIKAVASRSGKSQIGVSEKASLMKEVEEDPCLEGWERVSEKGGHPKEEKQHKQRGGIRIRTKDKVGSPTEPSGR